MKCTICKSGELQAGRTTVTLERGGLTLIVKSVPADVCPNCGEEYVGEAVTARLLAVADEAARAGVKVEVREFVAA
ncbi:MAG: type II toxin-antitoxin system MqsA family antitoxin [Phycisphaerales bacterium]|nr:type II toxin-antitoxin system MqsA family antitoxin [Phycisphaerales bacterium]